MRDSEKALRDQLADRHFRQAWSVAVKGLSQPCTITMFTGPNCKQVILQSFGERGWEAFIPASDSNSVVATVENIRRYIES